MADLFNDNPPNQLDYMRQSSSQVNPGDLADPDPATPIPQHLLFDDYGNGPEWDTVPYIDGTGGERLEVNLVFPDLVPAGTVINIQDGTYSGGGPAVMTGDTILLNPTGLAFEGDGRFDIYLNGQNREKGRSAGIASVNWISTIHVSFDCKIFPGNKVTIRAPAI